eukprot:scaffold11381_cov23-Tisochrysis_lutea.AAC.5
MTPFAGHDVSGPVAGHYSGNGWDCMVHATGNAVLVCLCCPSASNILLSMPTHTSMAAGIENARYYRLRAHTPA